MYLEILKEKSKNNEISESFLIERNLDHIVDTVSHVLNFIKTHFPQNAADEFLNATELSMTEGLSNAIKQEPVHRTNFPDRIKIEISINPQYTEITIHDHGPGFDINKTRVPNFKQHPESGYGIFLIRQFMDDVNYILHEDHNELIMRKYFLPALMKSRGIQILIVDDDRHLRAILTRYLTTLGHEVFEAEDASSGFSILAEKKIQMVISDWIMPGENGIDFCQRIRKHNFNYYVYFILLTSKNAQEDIITGLEAGADDFIKKPFNKDELKVKIRAGQRVIDLEQDLAKKNKNLLEANQKIEEAYLRMRQDLELAAKFQNKLLPEKTNPLLEDLLFESIFLPSDFVAGDLFNYFEIDADKAGFYLFDVSGHGVASAMLSFTLNRELFPGKNTSGLIHTLNTEGQIDRIFSPAETITALNRIHTTNSVDFQFFTIFYGIYHRKTGEISFVQGGHPPPILISKDGSCTLLSSEGPAVGIFHDIVFNENKVKVEKGDRLYVYSDGVTECLNRMGEEYTEDRLITMLEKSNHQNMDTILNILKLDLIEWSDGRSFGDDITLLGIEFK